MIRYEPLRPELWPALQRLFGSKGACGGCWCQWWRVERGGRLWEETRGEPARARMKALVESSSAQGILAFDGEAPVGWCSFGPRSDFPRIETVKAYRRDDAAGLWCVNCFFIARGYRGRGVARGLLAAALAEMRRRGVELVEAYPVTTTRDGRRLAAAFSWTGPLAIFEEAGFEEVQRLAPTKPLVRLHLGTAPDRVGGAKERWTMVARTAPSGDSSDETGVRLLTRRDQAALAELMYAAYRGTIDDEGESVEDARKECERTFDGQYGEVLWDCSFVFDEGASLAAATVVTMPREGAVPLVAFTMTHPERQRRGLAASLMRRSIDALYHQGFARVSLVVTASNLRAVQLYQKLGFRRDTGRLAAPLVKKLGIKPGAVVALVGAPDGFEQTLGKLPDGAVLRRSARGHWDTAIWFVTSRRALERRIEKLRPPPGSGLWIAWPKKAAKMASDVTQQVVLEVGLGAGLVDHKVCAIDETWSGLRFVVRVKDRG